MNFVLILQLIPVMSSLVLIVGSPEANMNQTGEAMVDKVDLLESLGLGFGMWV